ncbi:MAG: DUF1788 domain-containing protein [Phycisphaerae bacterium]|nr:DUF1788 domain-containing protein [Phycisphaerae bacterium]
MAELTERLNKIYDCITAENFLRCESLCNEIGYYIFDYMPENELEVRDHIIALKKQLAGQAQLKVADINLFELLIDHLKSRDLFEKSFQMETDKGLGHLWKAIKAPLKTENLVKIFQEKVNPNDYDMVFITGVGNAWPLARAHSLLNNLQSVMSEIPLVLFYPGCYDGQHFRLFGKLRSNPYYRAFRLVP